MDRSFTKYRDCSSESEDSFIIDGSYLSDNTELNEKSIKVVIDESHSESDNEGTDIIRNDIVENSLSENDSFDLQGESISKENNEHSSGMIDYNSDEGLHGLGSNTSIVDEANAKETESFGDSPIIKSVRRNMIRIQSSDEESDIEDSQIKSLVIDRKSFDLHSSATLSSTRIPGTSELHSITESFGAISVIEGSPKATDSGNLFKSADEIGLLNDVRTSKECIAGPESHSPSKTINASLSTHKKYQVSQISEESKSENLFSDEEESQSIKPDVSNIIQELSYSSPPERISYPVKGSLDRLSASDQSSVILLDSSSTSNDSSDKVNCLSDISTVKYSKLSEERDVTLRKLDLKKKIASLIPEINIFKNTMKATHVERLPDKGLKIKEKLQEKVKVLLQFQEELKVLEQNFPDSKFEIPTNEYIKEEPRTYGSNGDNINQRQGGTIFTDPLPNANPGVGSAGTSKVLTVESLKTLHGSLQSRPKEDVEMEDPVMLKTGVNLMPHQRHGLAWLLWREQQTPRGGILADDMGLGKTLSMISCILKSKELQDKDGKVSGDSSDSESDGENGVKATWLSKHKKKRYIGGTLVVCPASLLEQWAGEVEKKCKSGALNVVVHHGPKRETNPRRLSEFDMVVTTYNIVRVESGLKPARRGFEVDDASKGVLHKIKWERIILDEAHVIRNSKSQIAVSSCQLKGRCKWALTGTPIQNKELDLFALMKFLKCSPFDEYDVWRKWVDNKNAAGLKRLNTVLTSIMLRRTKETLLENKSLQCLPEKNFHDIVVKLSKEEFAVYEQVLVFSRSLFAQFLQQRTEKTYMLNGGPPIAPSNSKAFNHPFYKTNELVNLHNKMHQIQDVKSFQILVLLLRLRQICCHPGLIEAMLDDDVKETDGIDDSEGTDIDLLAKLQDLNLNKSDQSESSRDVDQDVKILVRSNPVFSLESQSSKMKAVFEKLDATVVGTEDKAIIVSQWTSMLNLFKSHLIQRNVKFSILTGEVPVKDRMEIIEKFSRPRKRPQVLLLSLTAGGVGLNLVAANHLFLVDLHWNPQLESQACDRIYRVGQSKPVHVYKFCCADTIEERILQLQTNKLTMANEVLTGAKRIKGNKLSLDDLRMLFGM